MKHICKLALVLFSLIIFQNCKKENESFPPNKEDDFYFIKTREHMFRGHLADSAVLWKYGINNFQAGASSIPVGSGEQSQRSLTFDLLSNRDLSTRINIITPSYDYQSNELFSDILKVGEKPIGSKYEKFELELTLNGKHYTTNGEQANSLLKILKTENTKDDLDRDVVLVWFKINCILYSTVDTTSLTLKDGYFLAGFMYDL